MTATYLLSGTQTDRDFVRFQINDTDLPNAQFQDEEIDAIIADNANKWLAAADALESLHAVWSSKGKGIIEKKVEGLRKKFGIEDETSSVVRDRIATLRRIGTFKLTPKSKIFAVV